MMENTTEIHFMVSGGYINIVSIFQNNNWAHFTGTQNPVATGLRWKSWDEQNGTKTTFLRISGQREDEEEEA